MFHMEHCVFAAFLSTGRDHRDCGRPCDRHRVELRDRVGANFPVLPDTGCRNTVAQSGAEYVGACGNWGSLDFGWTSSGNRRTRWDACSTALPASLPGWTMGVRPGVSYGH